MAEIWFTADLHLGHRLVARHRDFLDEAGEPDVDHHDLAILNMWWAMVAPHDQVWVLGDLSVSKPSEALKKIAMLPGEKHLVPGNHDRCHPAERRSHAYLSDYLEVFASVQIAARRTIEGRTVLLSHFPYTADRAEIRYEQWRLPDLGAFLLHGHTHSSEKWTSRREIHVGLDAWGMKLVKRDAEAFS